MLCLTRTSALPFSRWKDPSSLHRAYSSGASVTLKGEASSPGFLKGKACVITDPHAQEDKLEYGDILVCKVTNDRWNSLISSAGALVVQLGGKISHGPMVARRIGIPCVSNLPDSLFDYVQDGDELVLRGSIGTVEVVGKTEIPGKLLENAPDDEDAHTISTEELLEIQKDPERAEKLFGKRE